MLGLPEVAALAVYLDNDSSFTDAVALPLPDPRLVEAQPPGPYTPVRPPAPAQSLDPPAPPSEHSGEGPGMALQPLVLAGKLAVSAAAEDLPGPSVLGGGQPPTPQVGAAAPSPAAVPGSTAGAPAATPQQTSELSRAAAGGGSPASPASPAAGQGGAASPAAGPSAASLRVSGPAYSPATAPAPGTAAVAPAPFIGRSGGAPVAVPGSAPAGAPQSGGPASASPWPAHTPELPEPVSGFAAAAAGPMSRAEPALPRAAWPLPANFLQVMRWPPATDPSRMEFYADASLPALPGLLAAQLAPADLSAPLDVAGAYSAAGGGGNGGATRTPSQALFMWLAIYSASPSAPRRRSTRQEIAHSTESGTMQSAMELFV